MDASGHGPTTVAHTTRQCHQLLIAERQARGWGRERLAVEFERAARELGLQPPERTALVKAIYRHETGRAEVRDEMYVRLYCAVYELGRHELLGTSEAGSTSPSACALTSHKFVPLHLGGSGTAEKLVRGLGLRAATALGVECWRGPVEHPTGTSELVVFPWGAATVHLAEQLTVLNLAAVASWRQRTGLPTQGWVTELIRAVAGSDEPTAHYVVSAFWLDSPPWSGPTLNAAMRLLAKPRVLLGRAGSDGEPSVEHAEQVERVLLRDGFHDSRIAEFGVQGISIGFSAWGAVSYCPLSTSRALQPADLIELEVVGQALWIFCHHLREQVEAGLDPIVQPPFDWRWLRAMQSRLTVARPNESAQYAAMRESVLTTSGLAAHLATAVDLMRNTERT